MGRMVFQMKSTPSCNAVIAKLKEWLNSLPIAHNYDELPFQVKQEDLAKAEKVLKVK
jgi:hypothetical protein